MTNVYGIFIGIEDYFDNRVTKVKFACKDAEEAYNAYLKLGCLKDNLALLNTYKRTTRAIILSELKKTLKRIGPDSIFIFFFAGHGYRRNAVNYLTSVDSMPDDVETTCIKMNQVYEMIDKVNSKRSIVYLDCCHSGIGIGDFSRDDFLVFDPTEYEKTYSITFAACDKDELSHTSDAFGHGIWSKYLLDALKGDGDPSIYDKGKLYSSKLQNFLRENVSSEAYSLHKKSQFPQKYGHESHGEFVVADLSKIFEERNRVKYISDFEFSGIEIWGQFKGNVRDLPGYPKAKSWKEPNQINTFFDTQIKEFAQELVREKRDEIYNCLEIKAEVDEDAGRAWFGNKLFDYEYLVAQSEQHAREYLLKNILEIKNSTFYTNLDDTLVDSLDDNFKHVKLKRRQDISLKKLNSILRKAEIDTQLSHEESSIAEISCYFPAGVRVVFELKTVTMTFSTELNLKQILEKCKNAVIKIQALSDLKIFED